MMSLGGLGRIGGCFCGFIRLIDLSVVVILKYIIVFDEVMLFELGIHFWVFRHDVVWQNGRDHS